MVMIVRGIDKAQRSNNPAVYCLQHYSTISYYYFEKKKSHSKLQFRMLSSGVMRSSGTLAVLWLYSSVYFLQIVKK